MSEPNRDADLDALSARLHGLIGYLDPATSAVQELIALCREARNERDHWWEFGAGWESRGLAAESAVADVGVELIARDVEIGRLKDLLRSARSYIPRSGAVDHADLLADIAEALGEGK